jgi:hypothetical protein
MTKDIDIELIKADFMLHWCGKVQALTELRQFNDLKTTSAKTLS